jgi:pimeloyl-ACP methyl ester carboxylesterase
MDGVALAGPSPPGGRRAAAAVRWGALCAARACVWGAGRTALRVADVAAQSSPAAAAVPLPPPRPLTAPRLPLLPRPRRPSAGTPSAARLPSFGPHFALSAAAAAGLVLAARPSPRRRRPTALAAAAFAAAAPLWGDDLSPSLRLALEEVTEAAALEAFRKIRRVPVAVPPEVSAAPILTAFLAPDLQALDPLRAQRPPVVLLHGFDSNCLEWRAALPLLAAAGLPALAFDILGWGFTDRDPAIQSYSPAAKREHLYQFWRQHLGGRPMVLVGASVGGAMAIDFAVQYPEAVLGVALVAPQCFIDGVPRLPEVLARLGVGLLKTKWLRGQVTASAYNTADFGDAMLAGWLHTQMDRYDDSAVAFIRSGGYRVRGLVPLVRQPVLVLWGRDDRILDPATYVPQLRALRPDVEVEWIEDSGHVPHCVKPEAFVAALCRFVDTLP